MAGNTGKKKSAASKKTSKAGSAKKKSAAKASPKKTAANKRKKNAKGKDRSPIYILSIMSLLCAVVFLLNKFYTNDNKNSRPDNIITNESKKDNRGGVISENAITKKNDKKEKTKVKKDEKKEIKIVKTKNDRKNKAADQEIKIYLVKFNSKTEKMSLVPMKRKVRASSPIKGALDELLKGPSKKEKGRGLLTAVPGNLKIRNLKVHDKIAVLDFNSAIEHNANGSILLTRVDQIVYTATQFQEIDSVLIKINGRSRNFLGSDGLSISGPIVRRR